MSRRPQLILLADTLTLSILPAILAASVTGCQQRPVDLTPSVAEVEWERLHSFESSANASVIWANGPTDIFVGYYGVPAGQTSALLHYNGTTWTSIELPSSEFDDVRDLWSPGSGELYVSARSLWRTDGNSWSPMPVPVGQLAGTSSNDVYVGARDYVTRFNGASWDTILATPVFARSIYAFAGPEVVVARNDSVLRWNGSTWNREFAVGQINDMWGTSPDDLYAVGSHHYGLPGGAAAWHWNGTSWISQTVPSRLQWIDAVSGSGTGELLATADYSAAFLRLEGDTWNELQLPTSRTFSDLAFTGPDEWIAVGEQDKVIRHSGATWSTLRDGGPSGAGVAWMESRDFVVVAEGGYSSDGQNAAYHFENGVWYEDLLQSNNPAAMDGSSRTNVYMTTWGREILRFDGSSWSTAIDSMTTTQWDVSVAPDGGAFTVGEGTSYRFDGTAWALTYDGGRRLNRVWARNRDEAYAVGYETLMGFAGGSWRVLHDDPDAYYQDVWGTRNGDVYVASAYGIYRYYDGAFERVSPKWDAEVISGTSSTDILALNQFFFFVFDGVLWNPGKGTFFGSSPLLNSSGDGNLFILQHDYSDLFERDELLIRLR